MFVCDCSQNALSRVHAVMASANADSMEGQLKIADALSDCNQLSKARRIYSKLLAQYGVTHPAVHIKYESFLSRHCKDVHNAEQNFLKRLRFFCLPKEFHTTSKGQEFVRISQRVEFLTSMKVKLIDAQQRRDDDAKSNEFNSSNHKLSSGQPESLYSASSLSAVTSTGSTNSRSHLAPSYQIEYKNLENVWPTRLYAVTSKHRKAARKFVKQWLAATDRSGYTFEYSYRVHFECIFM